MRVLLLATAIFGLLVGIVTADNSEGIKRCTALKIDSVRLACLDYIAKGNLDSASEDTADSDETASPPLAHNNWKVGFETSKVDDTRTVVLSTQALDVSSGQYGNISRFTLLISCRENTTNFWIHFGGHFMSDYQHGRVTYRIDKNPAQNKRFRESNDNKYLGLGNGRAAIPFIKALFGAERLYVKATPHSESSVDAEFNISGLESVINPLRNSCHW